MKMMFMTWAILGVIALILVALTKDGKDFFKLRKPIWRINFLEILAVTIVLYFMIPLTIPKTVKMIFSKK